MDGGSGWSFLVSFGAGYEADLAEFRLQDAEIPVLRKGPEPGIFGAAFAGQSPLGVEL